MSLKIENFFRRNDFSAADIMYVVRESNKTAIYLLDGRVIETYNTLKEIKETLPEDDFLFPNKGVIAAISQVVSVNDGHYEMADGRIFKYRVHNSLKHDNRLLMIGRRMEQLDSSISAPIVSDIGKESVIVDKLPLPFAVLELIFDEHGGGADFYCRYVNDALLDYYGFKREDVSDESLLSTFPTSIKKWFAVLTDVAMNRTSKHLSETMPDTKQRVEICCYSPHDGFVACVLIPEVED